MTDAEADADEQAVIADLLDEVMMWRKAASVDSLDALRNLARVARGERQPAAPLVVEIPCECHCCQKMEAAEQKAKDADRRRRLARVAMLMRGKRLAP